MGEMITGVYSRIIIEIYNTCMIANSGRYVKVGAGNNTRRKGV